MFNENYNEYELPTRQPKTNPAVLACRAHARRVGHALLIWVIDARDYNKTALRAKCVALALDCKEVLIDSRQQVIAAEHGVRHTTVQNLTKRARKIMVSMN